MTTYIGNIAAIPLLYTKMLASLKRQRRYLRQTLSPEIYVFRQTMDSTLGEADFKKIFNYYGLAVPAILGEAFSMLRGTPLSEYERFTLTYLGALTGLFDDLSDKLQVPQDHVKQLIDNHSEQDAKNSHELLFVKFYNQALKHIGQPEVFLHYAHKVFEMQIASNLQKSPDISIPAIRNITYKKGGFSLLFYRSAMDDFDMSKEKEMVYNLGSVMQFENDLFDVYQDRENKISTLVTTAKHIRPLKAEYLKLMEDTFTLVRHTGFKPRCQQNFLRFISIVLQRGQVCLDQLGDLERKSANTFDLQSYTRKELICDMEKPGNFLKMIHYYARCRL